MINQKAVKSSDEVYDLAFTETGGRAGLYLGATIVILTTLLSNI